MRPGIHKILITGGAGFIGSAFLRLFAKNWRKAIIIDNLTYAGDLKRLEEARRRCKFYKADISDQEKIEGIFKKERPEIVVNFAAQTHVDRSIVNPLPFIETNIKGTQILLDASKASSVKKFIHISTDEVYGQIHKGRFTEDSPLKPNSPYAASKAAADLLIRAYIRTHGFPAIIIRPCNNFGPYQYPEKIIPLFITNALENNPLPLYGDGLNVREWLFVEDNCQAIDLVIHKGRAGEVYNIGAACEKTNKELTAPILKLMRKPSSLIEYVKDRPGHDRRYALNCDKIFMLGWKPRYDFIKAMEITVNWYIRNTSWWKKIKRKSSYQIHYKSWYKGRI